jgi:hypothetical protein
LGSEIQLETGDDDVWNILAKVIFPGDTSSITFDVKACHDARIGLESVTGSERYEIVICGHNNKRNYIRRSNVPPDNEVDDRAHPGLLSCFEFVKYPRTGRPESRSYAHYVNIKWTRIGPQNEHRTNIIYVISVSNPYFPTLPAYPKCPKFKAA